MKKALVLLACVALVFAVMSCEQEKAKTAEDYFFVELGNCGDGWTPEAYVDSVGNATVTLKGNTLTGIVDNTKVDSGREQNRNHVRISLTAAKEAANGSATNGTYDSSVAAQYIKANGSPRATVKPDNIFAVDVTMQTHTFVMDDGNIIELTINVDTINESENN